MCRWLFYYGKETCVSNLIYGANHALARQSEGAGYTPGCDRDNERNHEVNVHGCGIGWYASAEQGLIDEMGLSAYSRPTVYTSLALPTHDRNLRRLSKNVETSLLFGHVRAAGPGAAVHEYNTHPFVMGRYMFMHNGGIAKYQRLRRGLLARVRDDIFDLVSGTTDSELIFALMMNELPGLYSLQPAKALQDAMRRTIEIITEAAEGAPSSLNMALTDGETIIATRFRNGDGEVPPSLYFHAGPLPGEEAWDLTNVGGFEGKFACQPPESSHRRISHRCFSRCPATRANQRQAILVASEPLSVTRGCKDGVVCPSGWKAFPAQSMLTVCVAQDTSEPQRRTRRTDLLECQKECENAVGLQLMLDSLCDLAGQERSPASPTLSPSDSADDSPKCSPRRFFPTDSTAQGSASSSPASSVRNSPRQDVQHFDSGDSVVFEASGMS